MFKSHPKGLPILFFTEMWERFGFYLILGIFFIYLTDNVTGGMGKSEEAAADIYGTFIALVYLSPFIGGLIADRVLGYRKSIIIGGILMGLGYIGLSFHDLTTFWISILLIVMGNGFVKPNISTLVGNLYSESKYKDQKDSGFNIFYMGINIGAFVSNFAAAYLRNEFGWSYAFIAAGIGMFLGVGIFLAGQKHVLSADVLKPKKPEDMSLPKITGIILAPAAAAGILGWIIPGNVFGSDSLDAFLFACIPVALFYISLLFRSSKEEREPIAALLIIFLVVIVFWAIFYQNGAALTLWAQNYTKRALPESVESVANTFRFVENVRLYPDSIDTDGKVVVMNGDTLKSIVPTYYFQNVTPDQYPPVEKETKLISTELFQSINPFFIVLMTPVVVGFFAFLNRKRREPSTPGKIGLGLFVTALSPLLMIAAVHYSLGLTEKVSPMWLVGTYFIITLGELALSPMGLSLVSKISPPRFTALMMGGWFLAMSIGGKLSGLLSGLWNSFESKENFFLMNFIGLFGAGLVVLFLMKWLRRIVKEHGA